MKVVEKNKIKVVDSFPIKEEDEEECLTCGNTGRTADDPFKCNDCGRVYKVKSLQETVDNTNVYIPIKYKNSPWDSNIIKKSLNDGVKDINLRSKQEKWVEVLDLLLNSVKMNKPVNGAFYLSSLANTSKTRWAYTLLAIAEKNDYQIHSIIDAIDINFDLDLKDLIEADILVIRLTNFKIKEAMENLNYLLPKRADKDLMTVVLTRMPYTYVSKMTDYISFDIQQVTLY